MKTTKILSAITMLLVMITCQPGLHAMNSTPTYDATGIWKSNAGDTIVIFQEKDEVNAILINQGWAHRLAGRYVSPTKVKLILIRRTRSGGCEATMEVDFTVNSSNAIAMNAIASETACGITAGQSFPNTLTRIL